MSYSTPKPKRPILLADLAHFDYIEEVIIESLEQALYRVEVVIGGQVYYVNEAPGKSLTRRSIVELQALLAPFVIQKMCLRQFSPYDEMIGFEPNDNSNELLVPLGNFFTTAMAEQEQSTKH